VSESLRHRDARQLPKEPKTLRQLLRATIAAFPLVAGTPAHAGDIQKPSQWRTEVWKGDMENPLDRRYQQFLNSLRGVHVVPGTPNVPLRGFEQFCREFAIFCKRFLTKDAGVNYDDQLTRERYETLIAINTRVNRIPAMEDLEQYQIREWWVMPGAGADCEDYVLLKKLELGYSFFHPSQFHLLIVRDEKGEGHAVLGVTVRYNGMKHTLILDNKTDEIITLDAMEKKYSRRIFATFAEQGLDGTLATNFYTYRSEKPSTKTRDR
jgi:predicted transglutaminase-like cysteine proteinase